MTDIVGIGATTHVVEQGADRVQVSKQALEGLCEQIKGDQAFPLRLDHDPSLMPLGKIVDAWIEPYGDEFALFQRSYLEDSIRLGTHGRSGITVVTLPFENDPRPFARTPYDQLEDCVLQVSVDLANFDALEAYTQFTQDVLLIDDSIICSKGIVRHSFTPEPLIQLVVTNPEITVPLAVGVWVIRRLEKFVRYTVDETLRKTADDISDALSAKLQRVLQTYLRYRAKDDRAITTEVVIPSNVTLNLLVKTTVGEAFPTLELKGLVTEMEKYGDVLQNANTATFEKVGTGPWQFLYVTTRSGEVLGTLQCYERTVATLKNFNREENLEESQ